MGVGVLKPVCGYESLYSVTDRGEVFSHITNKWLKPNVMNTGYTTVELFKNGKSKRLLIHRLVASAFIENPCNLPFVNHKDENKANNCVENLEWCTPKYNQNYGTCKERRLSKLKSYWASEKCQEDRKKIGVRTRELLGTPVIQKTKDGIVIAEYASMNEAEKETKIRHIHEACRGKRKTAGGYIWEIKKGSDDLSELEY